MPRSAALAALLIAFVAHADEPKKDLPPIVPADLNRSDPVEYGKDVEPVFADKCFVCHTGGVVQGGYDMTTHAGVMKGGKKRAGKVVVPGKPGESFLFLSCSRQTKPIMPPKGEDNPLTPTELAVVKLWIEQGAKAPVSARVKAKVVLGLPPAVVTPVRAVAVSPDGKVVAAGRGNQVHLFDGKKGDFLKTLVDPELKTADGTPAKAAHVSLVESMATSPDGKTLATGSFGELTLWDLEKGEPRLRIGGFADRVTAVAFSADGKFLATGGGAPTEDGEIKVFDPATGKLAFEVKNGHSDTVFGAAFSPDGKLLATCAADKFVRVWEVPGGKLTKSFEGHTQHVLGVGWTPDGKKLVSCAADNVCKSWDYEKGEKARDFPGHTKQVTGLAFVGKSDQFLTGSGDASVRLWNAGNAGVVRQYPGAPDFVYAVAASGDGEVVATGCEDGLTRVYNGKSGQLVKAAVPPRDEEGKK
ncbi:MAG: NB-ARC domain protein [Gemmataceae bacterium]|nr:NB-ARC domain protein [Gemmataceae bacterium]